MDFKLKGGGVVQLFTNSQTARFLYLAMPFQGLEFEEGVEKPQIKMTPEVIQIIKLHARVKQQRKVLADKPTKQFDDEIPF